MNRDECDACDGEGTIPIGPLDYPNPCPECHGEGSFPEFDKGE